MANLQSSLDEILTELGDSYDADITPRKIVRTTSNKIWLQLRAFARGLYGLYQVVAALKWRFDPLYCTDEELESTMRFVGTKRNPGKVSLVTITVWNNDVLSPHTLIGGSSGVPDGGFTRYIFTSANSDTFAMDLFESVEILPGKFATYDFYSISGGLPLIGEYLVSDNSNIQVMAEDSNVEIPLELTFDCIDNAAQLGYPEETLFEVRQRILSDNQRQEMIHMLEERLKALPNIHECTVLYNNTLTVQASPYMDDDNYPVVILPNSIFVIVTGSPTSEFAETFLTLCPFITTESETVSDRGVVYYNSDVYIGGRFPVHYVKHRIVHFDVIIEYGFSSIEVDVNTVENNLIPLLRSFQASTRWKEIVKIEDYFIALSEYQNPGVRILSVKFHHESEYVSYIQFEKTELGRLRDIGFQAVPLWG